MGRDLCKSFIMLGILGACVFAQSCTRNPTGGRESGPSAPSDPFTEIVIGESNDVTATAIKDSYRVQAALAQFFRWFQPFDNRDAPLSRQLDLLDEGAAFQSSQGTGKGREAYDLQARNVPISWENAHFVRDVTVRFANDEDIRLEAEVIYLNRGALEQDAVHGANIQFRSTLSQTGNSLPLINKVSVEESGAGRTIEFRSSYAENRLKSLFHHWLYLVENPNRSAEQFDQILGDEFKLNFPKSRITSDKGLREWLAGPASAAEAMHYRVRDFSFEVLGTNEYGMSAEMDWYGLMENGDQLTGRVLQEFAVIDDLSKPFAVITSIREQEIVPGTLRPDDADG